MCCDVQKADKDPKKCELDCTRLREMRRTANRTGPRPHLLLCRVQLGRPADWMLQPSRRCCAPQRAEMDRSREVDMAEVDDPRVDLCLFCLPPHRLRPVDVRYMAELGKVVPILPIVTKADTMSTAEAAKYRREVYNRLQSPGVPGSKGEGQWLNSIITQLGKHATRKRSRLVGLLAKTHTC